MSEFDVIRQYFTRAARSTDLAVGDDAALVSLSPDHQLVVSADMLVAGRHFFPDVDPFLLGRKSMAVNLSDIAAMGAIPKWATLSIALPAIEPNWLQGFSDGLFSMAASHGVDLIGGDTTKGPLTIAIQIMGETPKGQAIVRSGAKAGDDIWVTGSLGDAALALKAMLGEVQVAKADLSVLRQSLENPNPRCDVGPCLRGIATSMMDISDGLAGDMAHIAKASCLTAVIDIERVPFSVTASYYQQSSVWLSCLLAGGDDYELCFTAASSNRQTIEALAEKLHIRLTRIGEMQSPSAQSVVFRQQGNPKELALAGFDHFSSISLATA